MKNFNITVNGTPYAVSVEEVGAGVAPVAAAPVAAAPVAPKAAPKAAAPAAAGAGTKVNAPMPGTILSVKANVGTAVKSGDVIMVLEAMKMENDIVAPCDGTVTSIAVKQSDTVESNQLLATVG